MKRMGQISADKKIRVDRLKSVQSVFLSLNPRFIRMFGTSTLPPGLYTKAPTTANVLIYFFPELGQQWQLLLRW